ncbi:hypothetical protein MNB_SV-13-396 [hydrothermal vent metagenome]|uniref:Uncharacterized protein n=1 Tax=hydrothermal vent metagenome TaxID=652676 RepID=A0A1W1D0G4_9ZZZZ
MSESVKLEIEPIGYNRITVFTLEAVHMYKKLKTNDTSLKVRKTPYIRKPATPCTRPKSIYMRGFGDDNGLTMYDTGAGCIPYKDIPFCNLVEFEKVNEVEINRKNIPYFKHWLCFKIKDNTFLNVYIQEHMQKSSVMKVIIDYHDELYMTWWINGWYGLFKKRILPFLFNDKEAHGVFFENAFDPSSRYFINHAVYSYGGRLGGGLSKEHTKFIVDAEKKNGFNLTIRDILTESENKKNNGTRPTTKK